MNAIRNIDIVELVVKLVEKLGLEGEVGAWAKSDLWLNRGAMEIFKRTSLYRRQRRAAVLKWTAILSTLILVVASQSTIVAKFVRWVCDCVSFKAAQFGKLVTEVNQQGFTKVIENTLGAPLAEEDKDEANPEDLDQVESSVDEAQVDVVRGIINQASMKETLKDPEPATRQEALAQRTLAGADDDLSQDPYVIASCLDGEFRHQAAKAAALIDKQKKETFDILEGINRKVNFRQRLENPPCDSIVVPQPTLKVMSSFVPFGLFKRRNSQSSEGSQSSKVMESLKNRSKPPSSSGQESSDVQTPNISSGRTTRKRLMRRLLVGGLAAGTLGSCWLLLKEKLKWLTIAAKLGSLPRRKILSIALTEWEEPIGSVARQLLWTSIKHLLVGQPENRILKRFLFISTTSVGTTGAIVYVFKQLRGLSLMLSRCCIKGARNLVSKGSTRLAALTIWLPQWIKQHLSSVPFINSVTSF